MRKVFTDFGYIHEKWFGGIHILSRKNIKQKVKFAYVAIVCKKRLKNSEKGSQYRKYCIIPMVPYRKSKNVLKLILVSAMIVLINDKYYLVNYGLKIFFFNAPTPKFISFKCECNKISNIIIKILQILSSKIYYCTELKECHFIKQVILDIAQSIIRGKRK